MAPSPQEQVPNHKDVPKMEGERVVISGMSGLYPQSHHVKDLENILYNKTNPVSSENCRWKYNHPEVAHHTGKVPDLDRFDAQFFKVHYRLGNSMDSMARKILEQAYQAIYDAGVCPEHLSGKKVGVYIGTCFSETEKACFYVASSRTGFGIAGCSKTMFANRISYWLNAKGPSLSIDDACCSSTAALEQAYLALSRGECEAAIVGGANLCLHPQSSVHYGRIMTLCMDGKTKSFDQNADGCAKSEAINVLFLQKAKDAKRIYADVLHVKSEFTSILEGETGPRYGFYRDPESMVTFLKKFYDDARVSPQAVEYVEAFGSAVPEADKAELEALDKIFCSNRTDPLLVGSVMSNIGYGEAASGISAITKVLLGYHHGKLASNLHYETPRTDVAAITDGRMRIVNDHQTFGRTFTAVNGISVTGVNAHVLLHGHYKPKDPNRYKSSIPHLVTISGRQETSVKKILEDLKTRPIDPEELALFHNIHQTRISGHLGRGYSILTTDEENKTVCLTEKVDYFDDAKRPLWFVYSGMGSQWSGMGAQLMRIPIFAAAIERCHRVLEPKGVDIVNIITSPDKTMFDNILHSFVGIAAVQIGLTDILKAIGLVPDKIIGHSVGELGCAYADGCFTAEEMILSAYSRGLVSVQTPFIRGSMAAVGVGFQQIIKMCPPEIEVACHNGPESSTISGPADIMKQFVAELTAKGIFAREVPCSNIAYHSRYIAEAGPGLRKYLSEVIKDPKPRSDRWLSTSVPQEKWDQPSAKYSSAEYHTNNLLSPVLFEETSKLVPANAVLVEIAPHGLLQAILKRSLPESCHHIPLTRRGHTDNVMMVLEGIGKLYMDGYNPKIEALYPKVEFPVSTGTPMLSHLIEWAHHEKWNLPLYVSAHRKVAAASKFIISVHDEEHKYIQGNIIKGKTLYPFAAALIAAWDTLAMSLGVEKKQVSVQFKDIHLFAQPTMHDQRQLRLSVALHRGTGRFEILDDLSKVATGFIVHATDDSMNFNRPFDSTDVYDLNSEDIYEMFYERNYCYEREFRSIHNADSSFTQAQIQWTENWVTFIDGILQLNALRQNHNNVSQPSYIRKICIDIKEHFNHKLVELGDKKVAKAHVFDVHDYTRCGGVLVEGIKFYDMPNLTQNKVDLKTVKFVPRFQSGDIDKITALEVLLQTVAENVNKESIKVVEIINDGAGTSVFKEMQKIIHDIPQLNVHYEQINKGKILLERDNFLTEVDLVLAEDLSSNDNLCQMLYRVLRRDVYIINVESDSTKPSKVRTSALYRVLSGYQTETNRIELIYWRPTSTVTSTTAVTVKTSSDLAMLSSTRNTLPNKHKLVVLATYPPLPGLKDIVKMWRRDTDRNQIYLFMISDNQYLEELPEFDLAYNVLESGVWGNEYYVPWQEILPVNQAVTLQSEMPGDLNSLKWVETNKPIGSPIVNVQYAALNDFDAKRATGVITAHYGEYQNNYGMDFSGTTESGERVMGLVSSGSVSRHVKALPELLWPVPAHWSLEDAATVPLAYCQAYYCLGIKTKVFPENSVLVHGGSGALGQAAISIALGTGCQVFTTVSDLRKKVFLKKLFPKLKDEHIGNSRDMSFGDMVLNATNGQGCDFVISCVKGELKNISLKCTASSGVTFDTAKLSSQESFMYGMFNLTKERTYMHVDFSTLFQQSSRQDMQKLQAMVCEGIARGIVRPLSRIVYLPHEVSRAFRLLSGSKHRGRVLVKLADSAPLAEARLNCSPELCHVILCDKSTFGLQLADRLVSRGVRKLHIHCARPFTHLRMKIQSWQKLGVEIDVSSEDLSDNKNIVSILNGSNRLGSIEGVYIAATHAYDDKDVQEILNKVKNFDFASRKFCPKLKYFGVISVGRTVGQQVCLSRVKDLLPATLVNLPMLNGMEILNHNNQANMFLSWRDVVDATEKALRSTQPVVLAHPRKIPQPSLLDQVSSVADIKITEDTPATASLDDLGIESTRLEPLCAFFRDVHNLGLSVEQIPELTVENIRQLEENITDMGRKEVKGLASFFSYVDPDELLATTEMVFLPTLTNSATMRDDEFDVSQTYICVVPGLEGHHERFRVMCERLKLPALVLQPGLDHLNETVQEMAQRYAKILLKKTELKNNFYLLGYESGVMIALEVAAILEEHGLTGTVFCVGGTPDDIQEAMEHQLINHTTEESLQNAVIRHMFGLMAGENCEDIENLLENKSWREKIDISVRTLLGRVPHSAQYAKSLIEAAYARIGQARHYSTNIQIQSKLVVLRAGKLSTSKNTIGNVAKHVDFFDLRLPLAHSAQDLRITAIINQYLDQKILESYENKNLCETYLLNADTFMTNASE